MNILGGITKIGEGYTHPEAHIPIDIQYNKLIDWLIDRKKAQVTWKKQLKPIQDKIQELLKELPTDIPELASYTRKEKINYYDCVQIFKLLVEKANEPTTKTLFGSYTSKRLKDWDETIRAYEVECVHIADAGNTLVALINFDIPVLKRSIEQNRKLISDLTRKQAEYERNVQGFKKKYEDNCAEWGIQGQNLRQELLDLVSDLPSCFDEVVDAMQQDTIKQAAEYYLEFMKYTLNVESTGQTKTASLPVLQYMLEYGNQTVDAYNHKDDPTHLVVKEEQKVEENEPEQAPETKSLEIDWTVIDSEPEKPAETPVINWDIAVEDTGKGAQEPTLVWDFSVDETSEEAKQPQLDLDMDMSNITAIELVEANSSANENVTESLLENTKMRNLLLNELLELKCFLTQREDELTDEKESFITSLVTPILKTNLSAASVSQSLEQLNYVIDMIETSRMKQLLELKNSKRFLDRVVASFEHLIECQEKSTKSIEYNQKKVEELQEQTQEIYPKLEAATQQAKELKVALEQTLSTQYGNRTVNIYGEEVNKL